MKSGSLLEKRIAAGQFAVTAEVGPPCSPCATEIHEKAELLRGTADGYNVTDCQTAVVRMSSIAGAALLQQDGLESVMQMVTRDRNRIAIQSDILGAAALGIRNCLCIAGDHQSFSAAGKLHGHAESKNVYDVDSIQLIAMLKGMRDDGVLVSGDPIDEPLPMFIGAAWTPMADPVAWRVVRLAKKVAAGADFIQTQGIFDVAEFAEVMKKVRARGLHEKTAIMAGIIVPKNRGMLRYMNANVAGVSVPDEMIKRFPVIKKAMEPARKKELRAATKQLAKDITVELIEQCREIEGVAGVHIQAIEWEAAIGDIVKAAGLHPRPEL
jgi:methylenetetrahydrofolate reductase (NADH)